LRRPPKRTDTEATLAVLESHSKVGYGNTLKREKIRSKHSKNTRRNGGAQPGKKKNCPKKQPPGLVPYGLE